MKFKKLITGSIVAASLFGVSLGSSYMNSNAYADDGNSSSTIASDPNSDNPGSATGNSSTTGHNGLKTSTQDPTKSGVTSGRKQTNDSNTINTPVGANVNNGVLKLDSVPSLTFGSNDINSNQYTNNLPYQNDNSNGEDNSGTNNKGTLQVTDNRNTSKNSDSNGPWSVQASLSNFSKDGQLASDNNWNIHLKQTSVDNNEGQGVSMSQSQLSSNKGYATIMKTSNDNSSSNSGHGTNIVTYDHDTASLDTPYNVQLGRYNANINWTLIANADNQANITNGDKNQEKQ